MPKLLGEGTYSKVYVNDKGQAVKQIRYTNLESAVREIALLSILSHTNIVELEGVEYTKDAVEIAMARYQSNLADDIVNGQIVDPNAVYRASHDLICAVAYLHSVGVIHCDIKPENILTSDGMAVLCDFGISVVVGEKYSRGNIQTCIYRAPEIDVDKKTSMYQDKIDVWGIGCVLFEMATGRQFVKYEKDVDDSSIYISKAFGLPIPDTRKERIKELKKVNIQFIKEHVIRHLREASMTRYLKYFDDGFVSLIAQCLHPDVKKRISSKGALDIIATIVNKNKILKITPELGHNVLVSYSQANYDDLSVLENMPLALIKVCSKTVSVCAQGIYERLPNPDPGAEELTKSCCLYLAACVFSSSMSAVRDVVDARWKREKTDICAMIMSIIDGRVI